MRFNSAICGLALISLTLTACAKREAITEEELQRPVDIEPVVTEEIEADAAPEANAQSAEGEENADADGESAAAPSLEAVTFAEVVDVVQPGLGCSFINADDESLLFATLGDGPGQTIEAAVKIDGTLVPLRGQGDYEALEAGAALTGDAITVAVDRAEGEGRKVGVETLEWSAQIVVTQDEGGSKSYDGRYSCGA